MTELAATTTLDFHPLSAIFPLVEGIQFDELVADVKAFGLREPILIFEGKVLMAAIAIGPASRPAWSRHLSFTRATTPSPT